MIHLIMVYSKILQDFIGGMLLCLLQKAHSNTNKV